MNIVNLTPHVISIDLEEKRLEIQPSGQIARCSVEQVDISPICNIPVVINTYGEVTGLPETENIPEDTIYLVSSLVLGRVDSKYKGKVFAPDTGATAIRYNGQVIAVTRLVGI